MGGGGGSLVGAFFLGTLLPEVDFITSRRLVLCFHCIPMMSGIGEASCIWLSSTGDCGWLNTLKSSSELDTSTIFPSSSSSSSLTIGREEEASTLGTPSSMGLVVRTPFGIGPEIRKLDAATLI